MAAALEQVAAVLSYSGVYGNVVLMRRSVPPLLLQNEWMELRSKGGMCHSRMLLSAVVFSFLVTVISYHTRRAYEPEVE